MKIYVHSDGAQEEKERKGNKKSKPSIVCFKAFSHYDNTEKRLWAMRGCRKHSRLSRYFQHTNGTRKIWNLLKCKCWVNTFQASQKTMAKQSDTKSAILNSFLSFFRRSLFNISFNLHIRAGRARDTEERGTLQLPRVHAFKLTSSRSERTQIRASTIFSGKTCQLSQIMSSIFCVSLFSVSLCDIRTDCVLMFYLYSGGAGAANWNDYYGA